MAPNAQNTVSTMKASERSRKRRSGGHDHKRDDRGFSKPQWQPTRLQSASSRTVKAAALRLACGTARSPPRAVDQAVQGVPRWTNQIEPVATQERINFWISRFSRLKATPFLMSTGSAVLSPKSAQAAERTPQPEKSSNTN